MNYKLFILFLCTSVLSFSQHKKAYAVYSGTGKKSNFNKIVKKALATDVVLLGELHNNPIAHWLELELASALESKSTLVFGAEMFERHQQKALNEYLKGLITNKEFIKDSNLWSNYKTDYKPLVDFAKEKGLPFIATNITRKYASLVHKGGFKKLDSLTISEKKTIAPLPIPFDSELPQYKNILTMMGEHGTPNLVKAQAIKDATMAHFIVDNTKKNSLFFHINGSYHSNFKEGIGWYINQYKPELKTITITVVEQDSIEKLAEEHEKKADFIICVPSTMTKTY